MRTWIDALEGAGELIRIDKPVDPLTQMGALLYQSREKALLFDNLPHGWRSLGQAPANLRHAALAFGTTEQLLVPTVAARMGKLVAPQMVSSGPVKEMKVPKSELDLRSLPVHVAGQRDAGPVIGSWSFPGRTTTPWTRASPRSARRGARSGSASAPRC